MKTPTALQALIDDGVIDEVLRPLKSGKEAAVYVVRSGDDVRCAKVYKDMAQRSFQQRVQYQESRKVRCSRVTGPGSLTSTSEPDRVLPHSNPSANSPSPAYS